jgi:hypothetical protein
MSAVALREPETSPTRVPSIGTGFFDLQSFELTQRVARCLSSSTLVPQIYRGTTPEAVGNCMIAINFAQRVKADPLMVMQNLNVIQGRPSWSSPFLIALVNTCGKFTELAFEFSGEKGEDSYGCRASANSKASGRQLLGAEVTIKMAKDEGWYGRNGSKWRTMPEQMLIYRAAAFWARVYAPELSMGLMTAEEAEDIIDLEPSAYREVSPAKGRGRSRAAVPANDTTIIDADKTPPAAEIEDAPDAPVLVSIEQVEHLINLADEVGADKAKFCQYLGVSIFSEIPAAQFETATRALEAKRRQAEQSKAEPGAEQSPPSAAETPADPPPAGAPASSPNPPAGEDAGHSIEEPETEKLSPEDEARRAGRKACRDGQMMDAIPAKIARYKALKAAWEEGYQAEGELMEAEMNQ